MKSSFIIHQGKKAYLDFFIAEKPPYDDCLLLQLTSIAGPQSVVKGIKAALLNHDKVTISINGQDSIATRGYGYSTTVKQKKLPSGYLHTLIYIKSRFSYHTTNFSYQNFIVHGKDENECMKKLFAWIKKSSIPFTKQWTEWLWQQLEKNQLITNRGTAYSIHLSQEEVEELMIKNLDYLKALIEEEKCKKQST